MAAEKPREAARRRAEASEAACVVSDAVARVDGQINELLGDVESITGLPGIGPDSATYIARRAREIYDHGI